MRTGLLMNLAASSLIVAGLTVAQNAYADFNHKSAGAGAAREAARIAARAEKALAKDPAKAVLAAEHAVTLAPDSADHRMLLGRAYLAAGRFRAAASAFEDVLTLDQTRGMAALSLALARTALGNRDGARALLETHAERIPASDRGLALALAGDAPAGVAVLEGAVRAGGADAKTRQNLAFGYAMSGRWVEAKLMASYDLDQAAVSKRIMDWAQLAAPEHQATQVAALLGVSPAEDAGMPTRLALAPQPAAPAIRMAEAAPPPPPARIEDDSAFAAVGQPVVASYQPAAPVVPEPAPQPVAEAPRPAFRAVEPQPAARPVARPVALAPATAGRYAVQIGAYASPSRLEVGWSRAVARVRALDAYQPSMATVRTAQATFYRLSVTGFASRGSAIALCERYRAGGGQCFVRQVAGDAVPQWALKRGPRLAAR